MVSIQNKWIVIRGLGRGYGHWGSFQNKLGKSFPKDQVYFLDLPGNGVLNKQKSPLNMTDYIPYLEEQLIRTDYFLNPGLTYGIGLSLGGMVLTEWALQKKERFSKIFLTNSSASNFSKPWQRISFSVFLQTLKIVLNSKDIQYSELKSLLLTTNISEEKFKNEFFLDLQTNIEFTKKYPITYANVARQLWSASRYHFPEKAPVPAVIFFADNDRFVHKSCSLAIQKKWSVPAEMHPTAGHDIAFEDGDWVIQKLLAHLA